MMEFPQGINQEQSFSENIIASVPEYNDEMSFALTGLKQLEIDSMVKQNTKKFGRTNTEKQKQKPYICFIPLPYCEDFSKPAKKLPKIQRFKNKNNTFSWRGALETKQLPPIEIPLGETPVNQYLDYVLSQQINLQLQGAKVLAEEVKRIKEQKKKIMQQKKQPSPPPKKPLFRKTKHKLVGQSFLLKLR